MKTDIFQLEAHDDLVSACDRMNWARSGRILLVWPEQQAILNRRLDLTLLKRHSQQLGAQLALVSKDREVRYFGPRLGIPVYSSLRQAQNAHWRLPRRFRRFAAPPDPESPLDSASRRPAELPAAPEPAQAWPWNERSRLVRLAFFGLGVLAMLAIAATLLPSARITLTPRTEVQELAMDVYASPQTGEIALSGWAPARPITVTVEGRKEAPVSGELVLPARPALGYVVFTNLSEETVAIPAGTVVRGSAPGVRFATTSASQAPAGAGKTVTIPVQSIAPGARSNQPANSLSAIEGALGLQLTARNPEALTGGSDRREPAPNAEDRQKLAEALRSELQQTAIQELQNRLAPGDLLILSSLEMARTHQEQFQPAEATPADRLSLNQRLEYRALYVSSAELRSLAEAIFDANLLPSAVPRRESLLVENLSQPVQVPHPDNRVQDSPPVYRWSLHATRQILARLPEARAIQAVLGLAPAAAASRLQTSLPLEEPPQVQLTPAWWPRMPILPFRIEIIPAPQ